MRNSSLAFKLLVLSILATGLVAAHAGSAEASLTIVPTPTSTDTNLIINWSWDETTYSKSTYRDEFWQASLEILYDSSNNTYVISTFGFQHLRGPHDEDKNPAPFYQQTNLLFSPSSNGIIFNLAGYSEHPTSSGPDHWDYWTFVFNRNALGADTITLTASHVPVPAAMWLLGSGLIGLVVIRRRRAA
jgi:hypothetical protein